MSCSEYQKFALKMKGVTANCGPALDTRGDMHSTVHTVACTMQCTVH